MNNRLRNVVKTVNKYFGGEHNRRLYFPNSFAFVTINIRNKHRREHDCYNKLTPWVNKEDMMS